MRWLLIVSGVAGIAGTALGGLGIMVATWPFLVVWCVTFPAGIALVAALFKRVGRMAV